MNVSAHALRVVAGAYVQVEYRPLNGKRLRPDLTVILPDQTLLIDVVVTHPAAPSYTSIKPLAATKKAEKDKETTYCDLARAHGARILALAVESYGAFGDQATQIVQLIRKAGEGSPTSAHKELLSRYLPQVLAVALQKGNAMVARVGALHTRQAASRLLRRD